MKNFMDCDFLLENEIAAELFHEYAKNIPIIDYHCHLSAKEIYENRASENITQLWLYGDHYKWRLMRANGIEEKFITGDSDDYSKFYAFASTLPYAIGNPVYHWTHLELQRYFNIHEALTPETAKKIWDDTKKQLSDGKHTPRYFIEKSNVFAVCTTEDPADTLIYHERLSEDKSFNTKIYPAYRPDSALAVEKEVWKEYLKKLESAAGIRIKSYEDMKQALLIRMNEFEKNGCRASDHGFEKFPFVIDDELNADKVFETAYNGNELTEYEKDVYQTELLLWLAKQYARRGWVMELHINAMRSCNTMAVDKIGEATGFDSVCDHKIAQSLSSFMNELEKDKLLPKTVLFSLNDSDNMVVSAMTGNFQDSSFPSKIQMGTAWWFQDNQDGMEKQLKILANEGLLGRFIGMLTDSRSFLSYPRHEYFRRILCNFIGELVVSGRYPNDKKTLQMLIERICFINAKEYFNL